MRRMSSAWNSACGKCAKSNHSAPRIARLTSPLFMSALVILTATSSFAPSGLSGSKRASRVSNSLNRPGAAFFSKVAEPRVEFLEQAGCRVFLEGGEELQAARRRIHLPVRGKRLSAYENTKY